MRNRDRNTTEMRDRDAQEMRNRHTQRNEHAMVAEMRDAKAVMAQRCVKEMRKEIAMEKHRVAQQRRGAQLQ